MAFSRFQNCVFTCWRISSDSRDVFLGLSTLWFCPVAIGGALSALESQNGSDLDKFDSHLTRAHGSLVWCICNKVRPSHKKDAKEIHLSHNYLTASAAQGVWGSMWAHNSSLFLKYIYQKKSETQQWQVMPVLITERLTAWHVLRKGTIEKRSTFGEPHHCRLI